ncbi:MAG: hypothetical protein DMF93_07265 [Acidobacteria bacterium]|nr:MAG: hypothetical protein DMF93_07265 [Acidobacteriota bacterium]
MTAEEYKNMTVAYRNGAPVRLGELGNIKDGVEDERTASWFYTHEGEQRAITLGIQRQPGTNTIAVADAVKALLPQFKLELPSSIHMDVLYDRSDTIRESYRDVQFTMLLTLALVIMVIFVFLRNVWATVIPSLALPFSIIGTFAVMYMLDYSLDNLSMMALILSVGFVVDDAIVMLENIYRHVEMGEDPLTASLVGSREIGFTIVSMTLSLAAVFIPVLFMGGVLGRLFREFSVTICVAILISGVVSVTLTPMLCSLFLKKPHAPHGKGGSKFERVTESGFESLLRGYDRTLQIVLRSRPATMIAFVVVLLATGLLFVVVPKGFIPDQDTDQIAVTTEAAQGTSYAKLVEYQGSVADIIRQDPNVEGLVSTVGGSAAATLGGPNPADGAHRRTGEQEPVSVLDAVAEPRGAVRRVARSPEGARRCARHRGSDERSRDHEPAGERRDRSRQGGGARRHREPDRERLLRRVRTAVGVDDLRAGERVQSAAGARA